MKHQFKNLKEANKYYYLILCDTSKNLISILKDEFISHIKSLDYKYYNKILEKHIASFNIKFDKKRKVLIASNDYKILFSKVFNYPDLLIVKKGIFSKNFSLSFYELLFEKIKNDLNHTNFSKIKKVSFTQDNNNLNVIFEL